MRCEPRLTDITILEQLRFECVAASFRGCSLLRNMTITGTITAVLPETSGVSRSGRAWRKKEAVVEYEHGQYPKTIVFQMMGDNIDKCNVQPGGEYELELDFEAREWQGRYFLQASCWKATAKGAPVGASAPAPATNPGGTCAGPAPADAGGADDLPF